MKVKFFGLIITLALAFGCAQLVGLGDRLNQVGAGQANNLVPAGWTYPPPAMSTPSPAQMVLNYNTPAPDPALMAEITLVFAGATNTQISMAKTEQAISVIQATAAQEQYLQSVAATDQAYQYMLIATQAGAQTQSIQTVQATMTAGNMTAWAGATSTVLAATQKVERAQLAATITRIWIGAGLMILAGLLVVLFTGVKIWRIYVQGKTEEIQARRVEPDMYGRYPAVPATVGPLMMPNLAHRSVIDPEHDDLTTEQALMNKAMNNDLEATRALTSSSAFGRQMARGLTGAGSMPNANLPITKPEDSMHLLDDPAIKSPPWSLIEAWNGQGGIPYGVSGHGMEFVSLDQVPHGGIFGKTGMGKSRYFLRPFIAAAIAAGHRVVILGKQADFRVFTGHPNVTMLPVQQFTNAEEAARYATFLQKIVEEMNRRDEYLVSRNASTWQQTGRESTLLILDELGNALQMMPTDIQKQAYRWVQGLVQEGRKAGFNVWLASQRAVGFKSIVEQLGRAVFHMADAEASRHALGFPGAEGLRPGQFIAKFVSSPRRCLAFDPTDDDLSHFLAGRQVKVHEPIDWIEGTVTDIDTSPTQTVDGQIREVLERMRQEGNVSLSQVQREVFEDVNTGGANFRRIQKVWIEMQAEAATTTGNMPDSGPLPGSATSSSGQ